jgi:hypothetical protein
MTTVGLGFIELLGMDASLRWHDNDGYVIKFDARIDFC